MIIKLSEACDKLPSSLFITGVSGRDHDATFGGGFGDIYQASYGGKTVALKRMQTFHRGSELRRIRLVCLKILNITVCAYQKMQQFCREALIWQDLKHPYILPMLGIDRESFPSSLCMVSPWMENGTVLNYLEEHGRKDVDRLVRALVRARHNFISTSSAAVGSCARFGVSPLPQHCAWRPAWCRIFIALDAALGLTHSAGEHPNHPRLERLFGRLRLNFVY
jgi:hypothetical protein